MAKKCPKCPNFENILKLNTAQQQKMYIQVTQNLQKMNIVFILDRRYFRN